MSDEPTTPFDSLESAHEYIGLLCEAVKEARGEIQEDATSAEAAGAVRRLEALRLVSFKLERLEGHLEGSRRILNDLRMLRRLLLSEPQ
jgi:hypothetical protein